METRKYQLQKQIVEALNTNNNELYALLKTQWAHRFGVESLVELDDIDLSLRNEDLIKEDIEKNDQVDDDLSKEDETSSYKDDKDLLVFKEENLSKEDIKGNGSEVENPQESFDIPMTENVYKENINIKTTDTNIKNSGSENTKIPKVKPLIPLPPKARYSYLDKWLVKY